MNQDGQARTSKPNLAIENSPSKLEPDPPAITSKYRTNFVGAQGIPEVEDEKGDVYDPDGLAGVSPLLGPSLLASRRQLWESHRLILVL